MKTSGPPPLAGASTLDLSDILPYVPERTLSVVRLPEVERC